MPENLLIITGIYPPDSGGPAKFAEEFGGWLSSKKIDVRILTYSDGITENLPKANLSVFRINRGLRLPKRIIKFIFSIGALTKRNQDVLVVGAFIETYVASIIYRFHYIAKVPGDIVWERARNNGITDLDIEGFQDQPLNVKYKILRFLYSKSLKHSAVVIVPSKGLYELCLKWGVPKAKLRLIYNSVDTLAANTKHPTHKEYNLITVCRLVPWKGIDELIIYVAKRKLKLLVVGDGPERAGLQALANSIHADVVFEGEVTHQRVAELLPLSELFVLNSQYEGLPHALIEARVAGVLSVGRAGTGSSEVINDDQDGFLVRPDRSLEETLDFAIKIQPSANSMIAQAKEDCLKRFSRATNFPLILNLFLQEA